MLLGRAALLCSAWSCHQFSCYFSEIPAADWNKTHILSWQSLHPLEQQEVMRHSFKEQRPCLHKGPGKKRKNNITGLEKETLGVGWDHDSAQGKLRGIQLPGR